MAEIPDPITHPAAWQTLTIGGVASPGVIKIDGISGFSRPTEWDVKKGKGAKSATLTLVQQPPAEGSFTFLLWTSSHFAEWQVFLTYLKFNAQKGVPSDAIQIYHPVLAELDIDSVVTKEVGAIRYVGKGLYERTIEFIEWNPVPAASIVQTPNIAAPDVTGGSGDTPDPIEDAQQAVIADLLQQSNAP